jgi:hypothetical protein
MENRNIKLNTRQQFQIISPNLDFRQGHSLLNISSGIYDQTGSAVNSGGINYAMYNEMKADVPFHPYGPSDYGIFYDKLFNL